MSSEEILARFNERTKEQRATRDELRADVTRLYKEVRDAENRVRTMDRAIKRVLDEEALITCEYAPGDVLDRIWSEYNDGHEYVVTKIEGRIDHCVRWPKDGEDAEPVHYDQFTHVVILNRLTSKGKQHRGVSLVQLSNPKLPVVRHVDLIDTLPD